MEAEAEGYKVEVDKLQQIVTMEEEDLEEAFAEGIMVGHQSADMPAFEFEPPQIDALTGYLRSLKR